MSNILGIADLSPDGRGVLLRPLAPGGELRRTLRECSPPIRCRRTVDGLVVDFSSLPDLSCAVGDRLQWTQLAGRAAMNRSSVRAAARRILTGAGVLREAEVDSVREQISDSSLSEALDDHQVLNVATLTLPGSWGGCVFDEQGTGKTVTMIAVFDLLVERNQADTLLVVSPKSMLSEWASEFERFCGGLYRVFVADGNRREKSLAFNSGADVVVINYETAVSHSLELELIARRCRLVLAVDESFNVKNPGARRTQALATLREWCTFAYVLCGTPAPNSAEDIVAQFDLVDFGYTFEGVDVKKDSEGLSERVNSAMKSRGLYVRNLKRDVLRDLPSRRFTDINVEMEAAQRKIYESILENLIQEVDQENEASFSRRIVHFLARRAALLRACSDPSHISPTYQDAPAKVKALDGLLAGLIRDRNEKVVIWSFYRASLDRLAKRYSRYGLVRIDGSITSRDDRRSAVRNFQEDDRTMIFLGNPAAAGAGLTLHRSRVAIYESFSNQAAHYLQSLDRIHRRGQAREVEYITLVCNESLEQLEYGRLLKKARTQAELLGDTPEPRLSRDLFLSDLLTARELLNQRRD